MSGNAGKADGLVPRRHERHWEGEDHGASHDEGDSLDGAEGSIHDGRSEDGEQSGSEDAHGSTEDGDEGQQASDADMAE